VALLFLSRDFFKLINSQRYCFIFGGIISGLNCNSGVVKTKYLDYNILTHLLFESSVISYDGQIRKYSCIACKQFKSSATLMYYLVEIFDFHFLSKIYLTSFNRGR